MNITGQDLILHAQQLVQDLQLSQVLDRVLQQDTQQQL